MRFAEDTAIEPSRANPILTGAGTVEIPEPTRIAELARRPEVSLRDLLAATGGPIEAGNSEWAAIELRYRGYLERERLAAKRLTELDEFEIPDGLEYSEATTLSFEAREKLAKQRPRSLGAAGRIPGVSPSDLQNLVLEVIKQKSAS